MHTMWKGSLSFGLVNVPVRMFAATETKDVKLRYLHKECKTPIQYTRTCPQCNKAVEWDEIVRGYEFAPNQFIVLEDEELKSVAKERSHTIDIVDFVELSDIDPVYYDKTYYLAPESSGTKAYRLLSEAMNKTGKIAIARTVLRNAETLACVRVHDDVIIFETLFWPVEVRGTEELPNIHQEAAAVSDQELTMAITLIDQLASTFDPEKYKDERSAHLMELIQQKIDKEEVTVPAAANLPQDNIVDLMQALQESIKLTKTQTKATKTKAPAKRRTRKTS
jgi:DNA end-binding protein Ku